MRLLSNSLYTPASNFLIARARHSSKAKPDRAVPPQSKQRQARPAFVVFAALVAEKFDDSL